MKAAEVLAADGPLARELDGFAPRSEQQQLASAVEQTLRQGGSLICEAGTGTGKTFAYLVPALLSGGKTIISTGTKNLQDQLFHRDLPLVRKALGASTQIALLKGRANYLCGHRLELSLEGERLYDRKGLRQLQRIREWAGHTRTGDTAECGVPEDAMVWPLVTSTADNCLGSDCPMLNDCHLVRARRRAQEAEILVVNHHLLFADMALKDGGFGELLPDVDAFIMDEAHQLPEVASNFFGTHFSARQLLDLAGDCINEQITEASDHPEIRAAAETLETAIRDLRLVFGTERRRAPWAEVRDLDGMASGLETVKQQLKQLRQLLNPVKERGKGLESCHRRSQELQATLKEVSGDTPEGTIHWFETYTSSFAINLTPLDVAEPVREAMAARDAAWVFTSATLAVGNDFSHFASRLGIEDATEKRWESPFDFRHQAVLYVPPGLPEPRDPNYTALLIDAVLPVLRASEGRAFLLFTSHRALQQAAERLRGQIDYPMLVQGEGSRAVLLEQFRERGNAVLLGTGSFWEGVDVRGDALSLVVIDKLPFASPGDPVISARIDAMRRSGGQPFFEFQLPQAVIAMKQGIGRLIRDVSDRGVLMLCDPRLISKGYGRTFLDSFPPMTKTRKIDVVQRFFKYCREGFPEQPSPAKSDTESAE